MKSSVNKCHMNRESIHIFCNWIQPLFFIMSLPNNISFHPNTFLLVGIPGMEAIHTWISIPFCLIYLTALLGNFSILFIIRTDSNLHEPMYFFLCMLSVADLILSTTAMPKILSIFWFHDREIYFEACLVQVFLIHSLCSMASGFIWPWPLTGTWQSAILWDIPSSWHTESSRTWGWLSSSRVESYFSVLNPLCFMASPTAELMSSLTPTVNLWLWSSWLVQRPGSAEHSLTAASHWGLDFILILCSYVVILYTVFSIFHPKLLGSRPWALVDPMCVWSWWPILQPFSPSLLTDLDTNMWPSFTHLCYYHVLFTPYNPMIYSIQETKRTRERYPVSTLP